MYTCGCPSPVARRAVQCKLQQAEQRTKRRAREGIWSATDGLTTHVEPIESHLKALITRWDAPSLVKWYPFCTNHVHPSLC
jgi:hypothetical protein